MRVYRGSWLLQQSRRWETSNGRYPRMEDKNIPSGERQPSCSDFGREKRFLSRVGDTFVSSEGMDPGIRFGLGAKRKTGGVFEEPGSRKHPVPCNSVLLYYAR